MPISNSYFWYSHSLPRLEDTYRFWQKSKKKSGWQPFCENMMKKLVFSITLSEIHQLHISCSLWPTREEGPYPFWWEISQQKWPPGPFWKIILKKSCLLIWNAEKCDRVIFGHPKFCEKNVKKKELRIELKWREMRSNVIYGHSKWPPPGIQNGRFLWQFMNVTKKSCILVRNGEKSDFWHPKWPPLAILWQTFFKLGI